MNLTHVFVFNLTHVFVFNE